jgi:hypothetical protein
MAGKTCAKREGPPSTFTTRKVDIASKRVKPCKRRKKNRTGSDLKVKFRSPAQITSISKPTATKTEPKQQPYSTFAGVKCRQPQQINSKSTTTKPELKQQLYSTSPGVKCRQPQQINSKSTTTKPELKQQLYSTSPGVKYRQPQQINSKLTATKLELNQLSCYCYSANLKVDFQTNEMAGSDLEVTYRETQQFISNSTASKPESKQQITNLQQDVRKWDNRSQKTKKKTGQRNNKPSMKSENNGVSDF